MQSLDKLDTLHYRLRGKRCRSARHLRTWILQAYATSADPLAYPVWWHSRLLGSLLEATLTPQMVWHAHCLVSQTFEVRQFCSRNRTRLMAEAQMIVAGGEREGEGGEEELEEEEEEEEEQRECA